MSQYQKGKTNLDFTEARDSEWQCHQLGHMQVCTLLQTDNHTSTPPLCFLHSGCPSCHPTNSVKALKAGALKASTRRYRIQLDVIVIMEMTVMFAFVRCWVWTAEGGVARTGKTWTGGLVQASLGAAGKAEESQQVLVVNTCRCHIRRWDSVHSVSLVSSSGVCSGNK